MLTINDLDTAQHAAIDRFYMFDNTLMIAQKGFGKTVVAWTGMQYLRRDDAVKKFLILGSANVCSQTWNTEWTQWEHLQTMEDDYANAAKMPLKQREKVCDAKPDFLSLNFENIPWFFERYGHDHGYDGLLIDEMTQLKSVGGTSFKALRKHLKDFTWRSGMTAAPIQQEPVDLYGQMLIIDRGETLGTSKERYLRKYFYPTDYENRNWALQPGAMDKIITAVSGVVYQPDDFLEREETKIPVIEHVIEFDLPERAAKAYKKMSRDFMNEEETVVAVNAAVKHGKLHQLCCGAMYDEDGNAVWYHEEKMDLLRELVSTLDTPLLVVYQFDFERDYIMEQFDSPLCLSGGSAAANAQLIEQWNNGEIPLLLAHPKSCAHGLNLQKGPGHTLVCLSYFDSADQWEQTAGRLARRGQKAGHVDRVVFVARGTLEETVLPERIRVRGEVSRKFHERIAER